VWVANWSLRRDRRDLEPNKITQATVYDRTKEGSSAGNSSVIGNVNRTLEILRAILRRARDAAAEAVLNTKRHGQFRRRLFAERLHEMPVISEVAQKWRNRK
jgi:DNA-binding transcriptional MocR family regulator